jgi:hypothetical protein
VRPNIGQRRADMTLVRHVAFAILILMTVTGVRAAVYHIDPVQGDDSNDGSLARPWKSFKNISSYYKPSYRPAGWVALKGGDSICLAQGAYDQILHPGDGKDPAAGGSFIAYFRGQRAEPNNPISIRALPGHKPIIDAKGKGAAISVFQSAHWEIEGIEVRNAYGRGISLSESTDVKLRRVHVHDTDGVDNNNIAGLYIVDCRNVEVAHGAFHDNYDRTCADTHGRATENSTNIVIFGGIRGGNIEIHHCKIYQSLPVSHPLSGGGLKYKHASRIPGAYFNVHHNEFGNCKFFAFGSGTANTHFHHNLIVGGGGISSRDFGGVTHQVNQIFEYNTIYDTGGFHMNPTIRWRNESFPDDPKNIVFRHNIVYDRAASYSRERAIVTIGTYISDELYEIIKSRLRFEQNCYFNPNTPASFSIAAGFNYKNGYGQGDTYTLGEWQEKLGFDASSLEADPLFADPEQHSFDLKPESPAGKWAGR